MNCFELQEILWRMWKSDYFLSRISPPYDCVDADRCLGRVCSSHVQSRGLKFLLNTLVAQEDKGVRMIIPALIKLNLALLRNCSPSRETTTVFRTYTWPVRRSVNHLMYILHLVTSWDLETPYGSEFPPEFKVAHFLLTLRTLLSIEGTCFYCNRRRPVVYFILKIRLFYSVDTQQ
jgi:hypothetical protein